MYLLSYFEGRAFSKLNQRKLKKNCIWREQFKLKDKLQVSNKSVIFASKASPINFHVFLFISHGTWCILFCFVVYLNPHC